MCPARRTSPWPLWNALNHASACSGLEQYGRNLNSIGVDIDVPFEGARPFSVGDQHGRCPVDGIHGWRNRSCATGIGPQIVDLVHLQLAVFGRIEGDAMVDGKRNSRLPKERHQIVEILDRTAARGHDRPAFSLCAIFSISSQSFRSELAILRIGMPSSQHRSTEFSSNGVAIGCKRPDG